MTVEIDPNKTGVDLGIIVSNWDATKAFYCDTLGFEHVVDIPFPLGPGGTMHRVQAGDCTLKLTEFAVSLDAKNPPGGATGGIGLRYFTFWVRNLEEIHQRCVDGGYTISVPVTEVRPGVRIFLVDDPDGNAVEFLQMESA
jgi:glyoxylase I family protein